MGKLFWICKYVWCSQDFSICTFSPCGNYLAGCTTGGDICVWNVNLQTCVMYTRHDRGYSICGLAWNPSGNGEIAYCDVMGQLGTIEDCIPAASGDSDTSVSQCWQSSLYTLFSSCAITCIICIARYEILKPLLVNIEIFCIILPCQLANNH